MIVERHPLILHLEPWARCEGYKPDESYHLDRNPDWGFIMLTKYPGNSCHRHEDPRSAGKSSA
jgi:hypothetical protein